MSAIRVLRVSDDLLSQQFWEFYPSIRNDDRVVLSVRRYATMSRATTRHKFKAVKLWDSFDERTYHSDLKRGDVPLPVDVIDDAFKALSFSIILPAGDLVGWDVPA